jgi:hypothetical protein
MQNMRSSDHTELRIIDINIIGYGSTAKHLLLY